jgi:hypothetical protein
MLKYKELNLLLLLFIVFNNENLPKNKKVNSKSTKKIVLAISAATISILTAVSIIYKLYYEKNTPNNITPTNTELSIVNNITEPQGKENSNTITVLETTTSTENAATQTETESASAINATEKTTTFAENTQSEVIATPTRDSSTKTSDNTRNENTLNTTTLQTTFPETITKEISDKTETIFTKLQEIYR